MRNFVRIFFRGCSAKIPFLRKSDGRLQIVSTIFPSYDFARAIAGENADVSILLAPGVESHSYEPTPQDIIRIQNCDLFLYTGGESDTWVDDLFASFDEPVNTVQRDLRWGCLLEIGKQAERFFHNTIKINYTFALAVISSIKIRTIRQTKVPT